MFHLITPPPNYERHVHSTKCSNSLAFLVNLPEPSKLLLKHFTRVCKSFNHLTAVNACKRIELEQEVLVRHYFKGTKQFKNTLFLYKDHILMRF